MLIFLHNDVCIYEQGWNERLRGYFEARPDLGVAGFHGSKGCDLPGQPALRWDSFSNMTDAERHGARLTVDFMPVAVVDGFCLTCRRVMLDATGGFDQGYLFHHFYDYDVCITSLKLGYKNIVVNVPCHHLGSVTAHSLDYHHWVNNQVGSGLGDIETFERNAARLREKHRDYLPVYVEEDFSIRRPGAA